MGQRVVRKGIFSPLSHLQEVIERTNIRKLALLLLRLAKDLV